MPARNIFIGLRAWPKTSGDFAFSAPVLGAFGASPNHGRSRSFSAMQDSAYLMPHPRGRRSVPASHGSSRAFNPTAFAR
jgi:hypothetical protein